MQVNPQKQFSDSSKDLPFSSQDSLNLQTGLAVFSDEDLSSEKKFPVTLEIFQEAIKHQSSLSFPLQSNTEEKAKVRSEKAKKRLETLLDNSESIFECVRKEASEKPLVILKTGHKFKKSSDGKWYSLTGQVLGKGTSKIARAAVRLSETPQVVAFLTLPHLTPEQEKNFNHEQLKKQINNEIVVQNLFKGKNEFVQLIDNDSYPSKKGYNKYMMMMEYCANNTLESYLSKKQTSNREDHQQLIKMFKQIFSALAEMQKMGVHHRDIKLENFFLTDNLDAKIGDFGLSILIEEEKRILAADEEHKCAGTPLYIAPEVFLGYMMKNVNEENFISVIEGKLDTLQIKVDQLLEECEKHEIDKQTCDSKMQIAKIQIKRYKRLIPKYSRASQMACALNSDVWSTALCLYFALTKKHFYAAALNLEHGGQLFHRMTMMNQKGIDSHLKKFIPSTPEAVQLLAFLQSIFILDYRKRPSAKKAYALFVKMFSHY